MPKVGDWVWVHTLPSLTAYHEGEIVSAYMDFRHWQVDLGDRIYVLRISQFTVITNTAEEILGEEYFA